MVWVRAWKCIEVVTPQGMPRVYSLYLLIHHFSNWEHTPTILSYALFFDYSLFAAIFLTPPHQFFLLLLSQHTPKNGFFCNTLVHVLHWSLSLSNHSQILHWPLQALPFKGPYLHSLPVQKKTNLPCKSHCECF